MKKLWVKGGIMLIGIMLVFGLITCGGTEPPDNTPKGSNKAEMSELGVIAIDDAGEEEEVYADAAEAIPSSVWNTLTVKSGLSSNQIGELDLDGFDPPLDVRFDVQLMDVDKKVKLSFAVVSSGPLLPAAGDFKASHTAQVVAGSTVYVKVTSESGKVTNYYCFEVVGLGDVASSDASISAVTLGGVSVTPAGSNTLAGVTLAAGDLPGSASSGNISLTLTKGNADATVSWAKVSGATTPNETDFTAVPAGGANVNVQVSTTGVATGDCIYIKVVAHNKVTIQYYGITVALAPSTLTSFTIGGVAATIGTAGATLEAVTGDSVGLYEATERQPVAGFSLAATASNNGTVTYFYAATGTETPGTWVALSAAAQRFANESFLFVKVTSQDGATDRFYKIRIYLKASLDVVYGQPVIDEDNLDPLWDKVTAFKLWRRNEAEGASSAKFLNTVLGAYNATATPPVYGNTEADVKVMWDDAGLYFYAVMHFHDWYASTTEMNNDPGRTAAHPRITRQSTNPTVGGNTGEHTFDSFEIFTNERLQSYPTGQYGIQYRISPCILPFTGATALAPRGDSQSVISGSTGQSSGGTGITAFRDSEKYFSWILYEGTKEVGYAVLGYIPWMHNNTTSTANTSEVFDASDNFKVKTIGTDDGPDIGVEFQLNVSEDGSGGRDAVVTWNGVTSAAYTTGVGGFGTVRLITGDMTGKTRPATPPTYPGP